MGALSDKKKRLEALVNKRKTEELEKGPEKKKTTPKSSISGKKATAIDESRARIKELEYERREQEMIKKGKNLDTYDDDDGFVVSDSEVEEEEDDEEEEEEFSDYSDDSDGESRKRKRGKSSKGKSSGSSRKSKGKSRGHSDHKKKRSKKNYDSESGSGSDEDEDSIAKELDYLDTNSIINTGRRTRGKRIDYTQFGPDASDDE